jgi:hypothetical protein
MTQAPASRRPPPLRPGSPGAAVVQAVMVSGRIGVRLRDFYHRGWAGSVIADLARY